MALLKIAQSFSFGGKRKITSSPEGTEENRGQRGHFCRPGGLATFVYPEPRTEALGYSQSERSLLTYAASFGR